MGEDGSRRAIEAGVLVTAAESTHPKRHYGRRKGWKLSPHQAGLVETLLPRLTLVPQRGLDPRRYFEDEGTTLAPPRGEADAGKAKRARVGWGADVDMIPPPEALRASTSPQGGGKFVVRDVWLEVGFGGGEHLAWQAEHNPGIGIIGAEPFVAGMAKLLSRISSASARAGDIRVYPDDALDVIEALPDACLGRVFILFPDPWPKTRHHKRRFLSVEMLDRLARVMREGAELRFATDDNGYLVWALERLQAHAAFAWTAQSPADWRARTPDWPETRYEAKALHGKPVYLRFLRRSP